MTTLMLRTAFLLSMLSALLAIAAFAPGAGADHDTQPRPPRCDLPYDPQGTTLVTQRTMRASAPALRWLNAVYGAQAPGRRNVLREVAVRPCALDRGSITVWTTNPTAMIRRAWAQPWARDVDIQWVRVRFGSRDAFGAVRRASTPAGIGALQEALGGPVTTIGDDPAHDCIRIGIDADGLPDDAAARAFRLVGRASCVELELPASPA